MKRVESSFKRKRERSTSYIDAHGTRRYKLSRIQPNRNVPASSRVVRVGFYGCQWLDRVVRIGMVGKPRHPMAFPTSLDIECPCGNRHRTHVTWRALREGEEVNPEVVVEDA